MRRGTDFAFVHGGGQGSWVWAETICALDRQTDGDFGRARALDVPGCGAKRGRPTSDLTLGDVAGELVADIESAGMEQVVLVGHSQGGQVMSLMAALRPALFQRLVHVTCSIPSPGQNVHQMMGTSLHGGDENEVGWPFDPTSEKVTDHFPTMFCNDMNEAQTAAFMSKLGGDAWPLASYAYGDWRYDHHGAIPTTFVICLKDNILPVPWQETFASRFRAERRVRIDAGHQAMTTRPQALAEILRHEAVDRQDGGSGG